VRAGGRDRRDVRALIVPRSMVDGGTRTGAEVARTWVSTRWRNIGANWIGFVFAAVVAFTMSPFIVHTLGDTAYGVWALLTEIVGYLGLLDLGVRAAVTRYVARYRAVGRTDEAGQAASAAVGIFAGLSVLAVLIAVGLAVGAVPLFQIPEEYVGTARLVVILGGSSIGVSLVSGVFGGILAATERFDILNGVEVVSTGLRAMSLYVALICGAGLVGVALVQLGYTLLRGVLNYGLARREYPELRLSLQGWGRVEVRRIFSFSVALTLLHVSETALFEADSVLIGVFMPVHMITFFVIGANLTMYARRVIGAISGTIYPRISALQAGGAQEDLRRTVLQGGRLATAVVLPIVVTFVIRGESFIGLWMGPPYAGPSGQILTILSVALAAGAARQVATSAIVGVDRHRQLAPWYVGEAVAKIGLSLGLVQWMGLSGVALGTTIPNVLVSVMVVPRYLRRIFGIGLGETWVEFWIRPLLAVVPFAIASYTVERLWPVSSLRGFFLQVAAILPVAIAGAWMAGIGRGEGASEPGAAEMSDSRTALEATESAAGRRGR
jgi:O-antigen/teichoic acid export membrane protein